MVTKIGIVSGAIITLLEEVSRPLNVEELEFYLEESYEIILMCVGWLARQGIIHIEKRQGEYVVFLMDVMAESKPLAEPRYSRL